MERGLSITFTGSLDLISFSTRYFFTIPFKNISAYLFIPTFMVSYFMLLVLVIRWLVSGDSTTGSNCDDLFF